MIKVIDRSAAGADIHIRSNDHCPPHVHAIHFGEGWEARFAFSYMDARVVLLDVTPAVRAPGTRTLNRVALAIAASLRRCRDEWWRCRQDTCLINGWLGHAGRIIPAPKGAERGRVVIRADYDPLTGVTTIVTRNRLSRAY
jgi:hypothetical protein